MAHSLVTEATKGKGTHQDKGSDAVDVGSIRSMAGKMTTFMVRASFEKIHAKLSESHQRIVQRLVEQSGSSHLAQPGRGLGSGSGPRPGSGSGPRLGSGPGQDLEPPEASLPPVQGLAPRPRSTPHQGKG